jgi:hypothetical protein
VDRNFAGLSLEWWLATTVYMLGPVLSLQADLEVHLVVAHIVVAGRSHLVLVCLVEDSPVDPLGEGSRLGLGVDPTIRKN